MVNGIDRIAITKLDVLDAFEEIKVCIGYEHGGKLIRTFRTDCQTLDALVPVYETFPGWKTPTAGITSYERLPANARRYIDALGSFTGTEVHMVSVGARRDQTLFAR